MNNRQHTPETWSIDQYRNIKTPTGGLLLGGVVMPCVLGDDMRKGWANARRIVACVNACAGFSNDELEGANLHKDSIEAQNEIDNLRADIATAEQDSRQKQARIDRLERERDELLAALEKMNRAYVGLMENGRDRIIMLGGDCDPVDVMERSDPHLRESRAAIASVKEKK